MVGRGRNRKSLCYVSNLAAFLGAAGDNETVCTVVNYADKPDLSMDELVRIIREETGRNGFLPRVPYSVGLLAGYTSDGLCAVLGRSLPVSSIRIRKFCATTRMDTTRLERGSFLPPYSLVEGLRTTTRELRPASA